MNDKKHMEDILYYFEKYHYENMILDNNETKFIHDYIINLQSKIDKAIEILNDGLKQLDERNRCEVYSEEYLENARDILKEDK